MTRVAFLGLGRLATSLVTGILRGGAYSRDEVLATHYDSTQAKRLHQELKVEVITSNPDAVARTRLVVLSVRPCQVESLLEEIASAVTSSHVVVSLAVGVPLAWLRTMLPHASGVMHVHPPALAMTGSPMPSFVAHDEKTRPEAAKSAEELFQALGPVFRLDEREIDACAVVAGCGPAYLARLAEYWQGQAVENGIPAERAKIVVASALLAIGASLCRDGGTLGDIQRQVATPGGVTAAGLEELDASGVEDALRDVMERSLKSIDDIRRSFQRE